MTRSLAIAASSTTVLVVLTAPVVSRADGMPKPVRETASRPHCNCPPQRHRRVARVLRLAQLVVPVAVPLGPYRPLPFPPAPYDTVYDAAMNDYFSNPSITGYRLGSEVEIVDDVRYNRVVEL